MWSCASDRSLTLQRTVLNSSNSSSLPALSSLHTLSYIPSSKLFAWIILFNPHNNTMSIITPIFWFNTYLIGLLRELKYINTRWAWSSIQLMASADWMVELKVIYSNTIPWDKIMYVSVLFENGCKKLWESNQVKWHREGKKIIKGVLMSRFLLGAPGEPLRHSVEHTLGLSQK